MKRMVITVTLILTLCAATTAQDTKRQAKPLTTAGLAKSLLTLAEKAQAQGMQREAEAIMGIIPAVLKGTPAN